MSGSDCAGKASVFTSNKKEIKRANDIPEVCKANQFSESRDRNFETIHVFFISILFFNLRLEYAKVFHKFSIKICLKYAYLRILKRANFMI